jgi:hypothetical protein
MGRYSGAVREGGATRALRRAAGMMKATLFLRIAAVLAFVHAVLHSKNVARIGRNRRVPIKAQVRTAAKQRGVKRVNFR